MLTRATINYIIAAFLAGRTIRSIAIEMDKTERSVRMALRRNPLARNDLDWVCEPFEVIEP